MKLASAQVQVQVSMCYCIGPYHYDIFNAQAVANDDQSVQRSQATSGTRCHKYVYSSTDLHKLQESTVKVKGVRTSGSCNMAPMSGVNVRASFSAVVIGRFHVVQSTCCMHDGRWHKVHPVRDAHT